MNERMILNTVYKLKHKVKRFLPLVQETAAIGCKWCLVALLFQSKFEYILHKSYGMQVFSSVKL